MIPTDLYINQAFKRHLFNRIPRANPLVRRQLRPDSEPQGWISHLVIHLANTLDDPPGTFDAYLTIRQTAAMNDWDSTLHRDGRGWSLDDPPQYAHHFIACCSDFPGNLTMVPKRPIPESRLPYESELTTIEPNRFINITNLWHRPPVSSGLTDAEMGEKLFLRVTISPLYIHPRTKNETRNTR